MRAVVFDRHGDPAERLFLTELPLPDTPPGTVRLRLRARPVNPSDVLFVQGDYGRPASFTRVSGSAVSPVGFEGAGIVDQAGPGVLLEQGTRAAVAVTGTWQEYVTVPQDAVIPVPAGLPLDIACQFTVNPFTAHLLLADLGTEPGDTLLLTASTSSVSQMLIRLALDRGVRCVCLARDAQQASRLRNLGAEHVVSTDGPDDVVVHRVRDAAGTGGVAAALDAVGGRQGALALRCLRDGGRHIVYGFRPGHPLPLPPFDLVFRGVSVEGFWLPQHMERLSPPALREVTSTIARQLADHTLAAPVETHYDLADIHHAIAHHLRPGRSGKIVLTG
ncbi:zinc-dependent alcohol dehydrogenase family protein [Streptomyces sp. AM 4-1-1]|uniref:zinc-dependent alcohol dehydrogenase family protein n=1 Tax=Streptomyces sp. AM 4-1-1 TaxID=3028710 RepID=UPI0023BA278B|nr:zinc-dependent alcohol dehydrogenase family protein [Streptomyces sp. AM 4-1-1]WEH37013.1 zinc-dependent alcohol dehydrogenase family protein [Streptomyces sp. AM 4-1-1]